MGFIQNYKELVTTFERKIVLDLAEAALSSIQPERILENFKIENIENYERVFLIGFGKGSARISKLIESKLGDKLTEGYVIDVEDEKFEKINFTKGTHPLPSQINIDFTKKVVERFEEKVNEKDLILVVVCGGGSALFELPTVTLDRLLKINNELLKSGKDIYEMNAERTKYSKVKGGGLAKLLRPAKVMGLIFSDVPGDDLSTVASGPTIDETATNILMLSNHTAINAMRKKAEEFGIKISVLSEKLQGNAVEVGKKLISETTTNSLLLAGGETTVEVRGNGKGGRNQELVLSAIFGIDGKTTIASLDSDGWDNTEFAGAIGDLETLQKAKELNIDLQRFLSENNSFEFFQKTEDGIKTGRLPSNIADLMIVYKK